MVVACLAAVGWAAGAASVASAAVIGFDDLQDGVTVQNQYASQGVVFDNAGDLPVVRAVGAGPAESPPNVADISVCSACEFFRPYTTGHFSDGATRQHVSVRVGEFPTTAPDTAVVQLIAYDTGHAVVAQSSPATVSAGAGFHTLLSADSANADIYSFESTARANLDASKPIGIDNLRFDNPSARTPDFALGAAAGVKVLAGSSVGVPISIDRLNGSAGNVQLGVAGLPQGVSSSISPSPAPGSSATLTLTAASDAPRSVVGATITGTPAGTSVGPGAHSRQLSIDVERPFTVRVPPNTVADLSNCRLQVPVSLSRDFSFPGPVDLAVGGLPSGVSASFVPAQATFPAGAASETVMLTLTAPPDVGVTQGPAVVTVTGTSPGRPPSSTSFAVSGACPRIHVQSIEVTQGIQAFGLPEAGNLPFTPATGARGASYTAESAKHVNQLGDGYARLQAGGQDRGARLRRDRAVRYHVPRAQYHGDAPRV